MNASQAKRELRELIDQADAREEAAEKQRLANLSPEEVRIESAFCFAGIWIRRAVEEGNPEAEQAARKLLVDIEAGDEWWIEFASDVVTTWVCKAQFEKIDKDKRFHDFELRSGPIQILREKLDAAQSRVDAKMAELQAEAQRRGLQIA